MGKSYTALFRALSQLGAFDRAHGVPEFRRERAVDVLHLQPYLRHDRLARREARAAHALVAHRAQARLRGVLAAEDAERYRPAIGAFVLHDEVIVDREGL